MKHLILIICIGLCIWKFYEGFGIVEEFDTSESVGRSYVAQVTAGETVNRQGESVILKESPYYLIYFSGHFCPPCRQFTKSFRDFYREHYNSDYFQVLFVSCDRSERDMTKYMKEMPWPVLKFRGASSAVFMQSYLKKYIPHLELIDKNGQSIYSSAAPGMDVYRVLTSFKQMLFQMDASAQKQAVLREKVASAPAVSTRTAEEVRKFELSGTAGSGTSISAIINSEIYAVGDVIEDGISVKSIKRDEVVLLHNGKELTLKL